MLELPQLSDEQKKEIERAARRKMAGKPLLQVQVFTIILAYENARLSAEVNRLRALVGEEPMKTYTPGG